MIFRPFSVRCFTRFSLCLLVLDLSRSQLSLYHEHLRVLMPLRHLINHLRRVQVASQFRRVIRNVRLMTIRNVLFRDHHGSSTNVHLRCPEGFRTTRFQRLSVRRGRLCQLNTRCKRDLRDAIRLYHRTRRQDLIRVAFRRASNR